MKWGTLTAAAAVVALGAAAPASALIVIDTFDTPQRVTDVPSVGLTNASQVEATEAIGGYRDLVANTFDNATDATDLRTRNGLLLFSNIATDVGEGFITYDGDDDPTTVNTSGLGGRNFNIGPNPFFNFDVVTSDADLFIEVRAWDMAGNYAFYNETLPPVDDLETNLFLSQFNTDDGFDFGQVGALQFYVRAPGPNLDGALDSITLQAVPVPAAAFLMVGAIGGLGALRLRRKS